MVFLGENFWRREMPVYQPLEYLVEEDKYAGLSISITDSIDEVVKTIRTFRPGAGKTARASGQ